MWQVSGSVTCGTLANAKELGVALWSCVFDSDTINTFYDRTIDFTPYHSDGGQVSTILTFTP